MKKIGFRDQLLFSVSGIIGLTVLILSIVSYREAKGRIVEAASAQITQLADALNRQVHFWAENAITDVQIQADRSVVKQALIGHSKETGTANLALKMLLDQNKELQSAIITDLAGDVVASSDVSMIGHLNYKDRHYFQDASGGKTVISEVIQSKASGNPVVVAASPVKDGGRIVGVLSLVTNLERISANFILPVRVGKGGYAYLADEKCVLFAHPDKSVILKTNLCDLGFGKPMYEKKNGLQSYEFKGVAKTAAFRTDELTRWLIGVTANDDDLYAAVAAIRNKTLAMGLLFLLFGAVVAWLIAKSVLSKLGKDPAEISDVVDKVAAGDIHLDLDSKVNFGVYGRVRKMVEGLKKKAELANSIAKNDLTKDVELASAKDELGIALEKMTGNLRQTVGYVRDAANQIEAGSGQVSAASQALSQGATEQAASLEEISSSMTEISSQTKLNAENSTQASNLAKQARGAAEKGKEDIQGTVAAMTDINQSSQQIGKIIKVIDDIAFQTNLLALNAAVEAARAGKHGKGFAVVADEVRNLASRSAKAAKETAELIESSGKKVQSGLSVVQQTATSFEEIVKNSVKVADLVGEIASASNEQAQGISQVTTALTQIDQVTQQNTASAEETASSAEELSSQALELRNLLAQFKLSGDSERAAPRTKLLSSTKSGSGKVMSPAEVIKLDDKDFGKY